MLALAASNDTLLGIVLVLVIIAILFWLFGRRA
jgi:hypothetical protein